MSDNARQLRATAIMVLVAGACLGISIASGGTDLADVALAAIIGFLTGYLCGGSHD